MTINTAMSGGLVFTGCEITAGASASSGGGSSHATAHAHTHAHGKRWEVVIAGKRIKTVDVHAHCIVPDAAKIINHPLEAPALLWSDVGTRLAHMDKTGVDVEALSINPFWYRAERDAAEQLIKVQNETLVEFCAGNKDRFVGFATAALQFPDLAAQQVEHAVKNLGFRGVSVGGTIFTMRSTSAYGMSIARPESFIAALVAMVPKVMICATWSRPYFCVTYSITRPRRFMQKSISMSGMLMRSGFRKRSNSNSFCKGSISVIDRA